MTRLGVGNMLFPMTQLLHRHDRNNVDGYRINATQACNNTAGIVCGILNISKHLSADLL